jgi:putative SOS response-associated peptidase YedK
MCGRFTLATPAAEWAALFGLDGVPDLEPRYNIAPTQDVAVVRSTTPAQGGDVAAAAADPAAPRRELVELRWGLVPHWARDFDPVGRALINARSETAAEKPSFRDSFRFRRCLVVADGFYEWKPEGRRKQPYWIHREDRRAFAFAGLWDRWTGGEDPPVESCTILTTEANEALRPLHDRMPVILEVGAHATWLDADAPAWELEPLLAASPLETLVFHPVSTLVNHVGNDDPACIEPLRSQTEMFR